MVKRRSKLKMNWIDLTAGWLLIVGGFVHLAQSFNIYPIQSLAESIGFEGLESIIKFVVGLSAGWFSYRIFTKFK